MYNKEEGVDLIGSHVVGRMKCSEKPKGKNRGAVKSM
jgi:hypothetical protein